MRALLLALAGATPYTEDSHRSAFEEFKKDFSKQYETAEEEAQRFLVFKENRVYIRMSNEQDSGVELGINEFADLTNEEFSATYMSGLKPRVEEQWKGLAYLGTHEYSGAELPDSVDWTTKGAVTPVKNQGQCGSCWSFSATGSLEGAWEIATGKLVSISEQQLVDCAKPEGNQGCEGGAMDNAFQYMEKNDMCTEESYGYTAKDSKTCKADGCTVGIAKGGVTGFKDVAPKDEKAMMEAVAKGPVSVAIEADKTVFQMYKKGVLTQLCGSQLDHGVLVVGYGTLDGQDYWKVKNSWGPSWGQDGFILLARGKKEGGECGVLMDPSYPVVKAADSILV